MKEIYLDHAATSPIRKEVAEEMSLVLEANYANPSSIHRFGRRARKKLDEVRNSISHNINSKFEEVVITSGGTEADNIAILGYARENIQKGKHLITSSIEHHGVLHAFHQLEKEGFLVSYLKVDEEGRVSLDDLQQELREDTTLVSIMYGNNEVGSLQPIKEIGALLLDHQAVFHTDAVQVVGSKPIDVKDLGVDMLSASAHKFNGPNGIGFLYVNRSLRLSPLFFGGEQERKRRAGTENIAGAAGMSKALQLALVDNEINEKRFKEYRSIFIRTFKEQEIKFHINGVKDENKRLSHILNISFPGITIETILMSLDLEGIAVSSGSACTAGSIEPSHVLTAMFKDQTRADSAVRFSFGLGNTREDIQLAASKTAAIIKRLQNQTASILL